MAWLFRAVGAACLLTSVAFGEYRPRLINGTEVDMNQYKEIVQIKVEGASCTATVVGPKAIITAAHCARTGAEAVFNYSGKQYKAIMERSPVFPGQANDISIGVVNEILPNAKPHTIWSQTPTQGLSIVLFGFGCSQPGGGDLADGKLRKGNNKVKDIADFYFSSNEAGGAALCFGDSGGPTFIEEGGKLKVVGVNSKGNLHDLNQSSRVDIPLSKQFLNQVATSKGIEICGVNKTCDGGPVDPVAPTCTLAADPETVKLGSPVTLRLSVTGTATAVTLDGVPVVPAGSTQKTFTPTSAGTFTSFANVSNTAGSNSCSKTYTVTNDPIPTIPTCNMVASPNSIKLGSAVSLNLTVNGNATTVTIDGVPVNPPGSTQKFITPTSVGTFTSYAMVANSAGSNNCQATYTVTNDPTPTVPTCTITANPHSLKLGGTVLATLTVSGQATSASIDGQPVAPTGGSVTIRPTVIGWHAVTGSVSNATGTNVCRDSYSVQGDDPTPPPGGTFTLLPMYCGMNSITETPVREVCITLVQYKVSTRDINVRDGLLISMADGRQEFLPIVLRRQLTPDPGDMQITEELGLYANSIVRNGTNLSMYVKKGKMISLPNQEVPRSVEGYSSDGKYFYVNQLKKL